MSILNENLSVSLGPLPKNVLYDGNLRRNTDWKIIQDRFHFKYDENGPKDQYALVAHKIKRLMEMALKYIDIEDFQPHILLEKVRSAAIFDAVTLYKPQNSTVLFITFWTKKSHGCRYAPCYFATYSGIDANVVEWIVNSWKRVDAFKYKHCFGKGNQKARYIRQGRT